MAALAFLKASVTAMATLWTSAAFVAALAFLKATATATATLWTSAAFVAALAFLKVNATAMATLWTSAVFVAAPAFLKANATATLLDVCGECGGSGFGAAPTPWHATLTAACVDDGSCLQLDCNGVCGGDGVLDVCGICDGPGAVFECGCSDIPEGDCDCDGNILDECGECGGSGVPDGDCDCNGNVLDECGVCGGDGSSCACDLDVAGLCLEDNFGDQYLLAEDSTVLILTEGGYEFFADWSISDACELTVEGEGTCLC